MTNIDLSLIIPCYNEESILKDSVRAILDVLNITTFNYEIIFVDDHSSDKTAEIIKELIKNHPDKIMKGIFHKQNEGRGKAVVDGIISSQARIAGFIDIDLSTSERYIPSLVMEIKKGADVVTALRVYKLSWPTLPRWVISKGYKFLVKLLLRLDLKDTETGCKFFNRERILPVLSEVLDRHWFWDTEVMARAYLKGLKIVEIPSVFIRKGLYSRVKIFRDSVDYLVKLLKFKREFKKIVKK